MSAALRPYVTAGIALVGASIISVTPVAPSQMAASAPSMRVSTESVSLVADVTSCAAGSTSELCKSSNIPSFLAQGTQSAFQVAAESQGSSVFNIPANLLIALANVPYNFINALGYGDVPLGENPDSAFSFTNSFGGVSLNQTGVVGLAADLAYGGSIWVYSPFNVLGTDPGDIARYQALVNLAIPFPALSVGLGNIFATSAAALLPMSAGCTGTGLGACPDINSILSKSLNFANIYKLFTTGYSFGEVRDPITCDDDGLCNILNPAGPLAPQSGLTETLDPTTPFVDFYDSLTQTPDFSSIKLPTMQMTVKALTGLIKGLNTFLNPFVLGTQCRLCAFFVPTPPGTIIPGPTNPGTQFPPFTSPVGPVKTADVTAVAKTTDTDTDTDTTAAPKTPFKTWKANHQKAQAQDAAAAAAAVDAAGTVDPADQTTSTTPKTSTTKVKPTTKKDHPLASAIKDAFSKKSTSTDTSASASSSAASTTGDSGTDTAKVTKIAKTPKKAVKATKVSKAADAA